MFLSPAITSSLFNNLTIIMLLLFSTKASSNTVEYSHENDILLTNGDVISKQTDVCLGFKNIAKITILYNDTNHSCSDFNSLDSITSFANKISPHAVTNINMIIDNQAQPTESLADLLQEDIIIGFNSILTVPQITAVYIHELGHLIFNEFIFSTHLRGLDRKRKRFQTEKHKLAEMEAYFHINCQTEDTSTRCKQIAIKIIPKIRNLEIAYNNLPVEQLAQITEISRSYSELFSDILTTMITEDPEAIFKVIDSESNKNHYLCRSMTYQSNEAIMTHGPHCTFSGLRSFIYKEFILPADTLKKKKVAINDLLKIFLQQIIERLQNVSLDEEDSAIDIAFVKLKIALEEHITSKNK